MVPRAGKMTSESKQQCLTRLICLWLDNRSIWSEVIMSVYTDIINLRAMGHGSGSWMVDYLLS